MTVAELIEHLKTFDPSLPVAYALYSEYALLEAKSIEVASLCEVREDGWVARERPDKPSIPYLVFPGN